MAKLFDTADAERLIQEHRMMLEELDEIAQYEDNVQIDIEKAANLVVTRNVLDVLRDIPVEEINREKGGFRVKALRDYGFRSIADIVAANVYSISSVHGISEDAAYSIKRIANNMADKVREGAKIKLSVDNKTRESTALVTALSKFAFIIQIPFSIVNKICANAGFGTPEQEAGTGKSCVTLPVLGFVFFIRGISSFMD